MAPPGEADLEPLVHQAVPCQPRAEPDVMQQLDRTLLENARADPAFDVLAAVALQDDRTRRRPAAAGGPAAGPPVRRR